ncbi:MAG: hypothetical protein AB2L14_37080 [Candidatus Xenobiia bacterium LiM19]
MCSDDSEGFNFDASPDASPDESPDASPDESAGYCSNCGASLEGGFCPSCGGSGDESPPPRRSGLTALVIAIFLVLAAVAIVLVVFVKKPPGPEQSGNSTIAASQPVISPPESGALPSFASPSSPGASPFPASTTAVTGNDTTYSGSVSAVQGGEISFGELAISFPPGIGSGDVQVEIQKQSALPEITGTPEQLKAYKELRVIGDVLEIKTSQASFGQPFLMEFKFDPSKVKDDELMVCTVKDGKISLAEAVAGDLEEGYVIVRSDHCSAWFIAASAVALPALLFVSYQAYGFVSNERAPWNLIEPDHPKISSFITTNSLSIPEVKPGTERFTMTGYNKKFLERKDTYFNRVVHLTGNNGSDVLNQSEVACWDLTTFFGSILYSMKPDMSQRMRIVKGTTGNDRHSWIEVVIDGQVFVANTGRLDAFEFVSRDVLYREQNLKPTHMYTKDPGSLKKYDPEWFKPFLYDSNAAKIDALKTEHRQLQAELEALSARGEEITGEQSQRMDDIRARQKAIYGEVKKLQSEQKNQAPK